MNAESKIKKTIMLSIEKLVGRPMDTESEIESTWKEAWENDTGGLQDAKECFRTSGQETGLECDWCRHYESKAVAAPMFDGTWSGWTYWYGAGKHGEPAAMDWMDSAYPVTFTEETVVVKKFQKA